MRAAVALLAGLLFLAGPILAVPVTDQPNTAWRAKADQPLLDAVAENPSLISVEVQGSAIAKPDAPFATRGEWNAFWAAESAPFLASLRERVADLGGVVTSEVPAVNAAFVRIQADRVPDLLAADDIRKAGLDWLGATYILDAPLKVVPTLPGGPSVTTTLGQSLALHEVPQVHALGYKGDGVKVAMIDTGIRPTHEMMKTAGGVTRVVYWSDHTTTPGGPGYCATPCDVNGHGTHTATTALGSNYFNPASPLGVAPNAQVFGVRIFQGGGGQWEWAQAGLQAAFNAGADITSNSWGGGCSGGGITTAELAESLQNAGMLNVFAAGNSGTGGHICPGMVDNVTTVGAVDINEVVAGFSSRGPCTWPVGSGNTRICPDVMGMGVDLTAGAPCSAYPCSPPNSNCDTCYFTISGTSMATPHVAGVTALLQQAKKALTGTGFSAANKESEIVLRYTAKDLGAAGPDNDYGWGNTKALAAYTLLANPAAIDVRHVFSVGSPVIRSYQTNLIQFNVVNLGASAVGGRLTLNIDQVDTGNCPPTCEHITVIDANVALPRLRESINAYSFSGAGHNAGTYVVTARYDFGVGNITATGSFLLKKVQMAKVRDIPALSTVGTPILATLSLKNIGNENASQVTYTEKWSDFRILTPLVVVPPNTAPCSALAVCPWLLYADPPPNSAQPGYIASPTSPIYGQGQYTWSSIGEVKFGKAFVATYNWLASTPGADKFDGELFYTDELGRGFIESFPETKTVVLPV